MILCEFTEGVSTMTNSFSPLHWVVPLHMSPQRICIRAGKVTLAAFVWFFSTVRLQMSPQSACLDWCKVTLVTLVFFFSTLCFQMCPQIACPRKYRVTLVASFWLVSYNCLFHLDIYTCINRTLVFYVRLWSINQHNRCCTWWEMLKTEEEISPNT